MMRNFDDWWGEHSEDKFFSGVTTSEARTIWQAAWNAALDKAAEVAASTSEEYSCKRASERIRALEEEQWKI